MCLNLCSEGNPSSCWSSNRAARASTFLSTCLVFAVSLGQGRCSCPCVCMQGTTHETRLHAFWTIDGYMACSMLVACIYTSHVLVQCAGHMAWRTCTVCHVHILHLCDVMSFCKVMRVRRSLMSVQECHRTCVYARHAQSACSCGMGSHAAFSFTGHVL